jgi:DNA-binding NarL/FixJ family response regulator
MRTGRTVGGNPKPRLPGLVPFLAVLTLLFFGPFARAAAPERTWTVPVLNGIEAARQLRGAGSRAKVVFLTVHQDPDYVRGALAAGALGYVVKGRLVTDLSHALREALAGRSFVSPSISLEGV